jgi:hypothetical protein
MQPKSANSHFDPLKPPQDAAIPEAPESADFETSIEAASIEVSSAVIMEPLKPPQ